MSIRKSEAPYKVTKDRTGHECVCVHGEVFSLILMRFCTSFGNIRNCRAQEVLDDALESIGIDIIPDHGDNCPYRKSEEQQKVIF